MKFLLVLSTLLAAALLLSAAGSGVTYVEHDKVTSALAKGGSLVTAQDLLVSGSHRDKAGQVEVHDKETDVIYVIEGDATFVTGGTMIGGLFIVLFGIRVLPLASIALLAVAALIFLLERRLYARREAMP